VLAKYRGEFIVPWGRKVIAHGPRADRVLEEAACLLGRNAKDLPLVGIVNPLLDLPH
jgi:hypothetical protein